MNSQFEGVQTETPDRGGPNPYSIPGGLSWPGDWGRKWNIKQKRKVLGKTYLRACTSWPIEQKKAWLEFEWG